VPAGTETNTPKIETGTHSPSGSMPVLRKYAADVGARSLPYERSIQGMAMPAMQYLYWGTWGYGGGVAPGTYIFGIDAANQPLTPPVVKSKRAGKKVQAIKARADAVRLANARPHIQRPPRHTPTQSECSEIQHGYQEAFDFWLRVQFEDIPEEEYVDTAELFDELPGVSGYFRFLCLNTITTEEGGYTLWKTY
jgi:hypothetical protein